MIKHALFVSLEAKPGKEKEVSQFLQAGLGLAQQEGTTPVWFALQLGPSTFGVFDAFADEAGRHAHLNGPIAQALGANAPQLLAQAPSIERIHVLGTKLPRRSPHEPTMKHSAHDQHGLMPPQQAAGLNRRRPHSLSPNIRAP